jgi:hypothetical protein
MKGTKLVRINDYTWIEKRVNESDEITRKKFLLKLSKVGDSQDLRSGF